MEDNKNSLLGIESTSAENNVSAVPFSLALPEEKENPTNSSSNFVSIESPMPIETKPVPQQTPKTSETASNVTAVPAPPVLLQKPEETKENEIPFLIQRPEPEVSGVNTLPAPKASAKEQTSSIESFALETEAPSDKISSQKLKAATTIGETTKKLSANEQKLKDIEQQVEFKKEEIQQKNMASQSYLALKPAFENIQNVLNFQKENAMTKDFDDSHYTVPQTQSFFDKTVNQLTDTPYWRGK